MTHNNPHNNIAAEYLLVSIVGRNMSTTLFLNHCVAHMLVKLSKATIA